MSDLTELDIKRIDILQNIIARMAQNSFTIKGWAVTLVVALLAFSNKDTDRSLAVLALYPTAAFWGLDAYYLMQERLFRALNRKQVEPGRELEFTTEPTVNAFFSAASSPTVCLIYAFSMTITGLVAIHNH